MSVKMYIILLIHIFYNVPNKITYSAIDQASPQPSYVEVPLPSSSIITKDFSVAVCKIKKKLKLI